MLARAIAGAAGRPRHLSTDHDPLFEFQRWKANLRTLEIEALKTMPYVPLSHPFVERLIGTVRREFLDRTPFWNARDLERKLDSFKAYYNGSRAHRALGAQTPLGFLRSRQALESLRWQSYCRGLFALPFSGVNNNSHPTAPESCGSNPTRIGAATVSFDPLARN